MLSDIYSRLVVSKWEKRSRQMEHKNMEAHASVSEEENTWRKMTRQSATNARSVRLIK